MPAISDSDSFTGSDAVLTLQVVDSDAGNAGDGGESFKYTQTDGDSGFWIEDSSFLTNIRVSSADSGTFADAGAPAVLTPVSGSDSFTGTDALARLQVIPAGDTGSLVDTQSLTAHVSDNESSRGDDEQALPVNAPIPAAFAIEGFSITRVAVIDPTSGIEVGPIFGVRQASVTPEWVIAQNKQDDSVVGEWYSPGKMTLEVQSGFLSFNVLAQVTGTTVVTSGLPASSLIDQYADTYVDTYGTPASSTAPSYFGLPMAVQHNSNPFPVVLRMQGRTASGIPRTFDILLYRCKFQQLAFTGPAYKQGLVMSWSMSVTISGQDEAGNPLPDPAYGRMVINPDPSQAYLPFTGETPPASVADADLGHFTEAATITTILQVFDTDSFVAFDDGENVVVGGAADFNFRPGQAHPGTASPGDGVLFVVVDNDSGHFADAGEAVGARNIFMSMRPGRIRPGQDTPGNPIS